MSEQILVLPESGLILAKSRAPWLHFALEEMIAGVHELTDPGENPEILKYWSACPGYETTGSDEIAWCAAGARWCMVQAGVPHAAGSPAARSLSHFGVACGREIGALVVLHRGDGWQGHVGFYLGQSPGNVIVLGANQSNGWSVASFFEQKVLAFRMPQLETF